MGQYGDAQKFIVNYRADATSSAINTDIAIMPSDGYAYTLESARSTQSVASTSGTIKVRAITDTTAPGAAASATAVELLATSANTASTANTVVNNAVVAGNIVYPGSRIATLSGGTQTNLVGFTLTLVFAPINRRV